jgi:hypothetical protein
MMNLDELEAEAMKLDLASRTELIRRLTASLTAAAESSKPPTDDERERLWIQEAMRRSRELREAQPANPPSLLQAQADLARPPLATAPPRVSRKKPAARGPRPARRKAPSARRKLAKRAASRNRPKRARPARRPKTRPRKRPRTRR